MLTSSTDNTQEGAGGSPQARSEASQALLPISPRTLSPQKRDPGRSPVRVLRPRNIDAACEIPRRSATCCNSAWPQCSKRRQR